MKILVTGGCGFIGSVLVPMLLKEGHETTVVDAGWWGCSHLPTNDYFQGDVLNIQNFTFSDFDAVIHLAGMSNDPTANWNPELNWELNVGGTEAMVKWASEQGIPRFVYASTHSVYGQPEVVAFEGTPAIASGPYPESKRAAEGLVMEHAVEPVVLRFGTVHGVSPRMRYDLMVNTFAAQCFRRTITLHGGGADWRPVLDVRDAARALLWGATSRSAVGQTFNVAHKNMQVARVAELVADRFEQIHGQAPEFLDVAPRKVGRSQRISINKAVEAGFEAAYGLTDCLPDLLAFTGTVDPRAMIYHNIQYVTELLAGEEAA